MTIREIAELANVSIATVSKIINHKDNEISDPTRQKVLKIIQEYQYTPYSNLKLSEDSGHTHLLALITHGSAYTSQFIFHVEKIVSQLGYSLILCNLTEPLSDDLRKYMSILTSKRVDGILLGFSSTALLEEAAALNYSALPMAAFTLEPFSGCASFILDYSLCAELSVMELIRNCLLYTSRASSAVTSASRIVFSPTKRHISSICPFADKERYTGLPSMISRGPSKISSSS